MDVPEAIEADVTALEIGDSLHVKDIPVPDVVTVLTDPEETVVSVVTPQVLRLEPELEVVGEEVPEGEEAPAAEAEEGAETPAAESEGPAEGGSEEGGE
jgi:large subunit ribosomal protein L25